MRTGVPCPATAHDLGRKERTLWPVTQRAADSVRRARSSEGRLRRIQHPASQPAPFRRHAADQTTRTTQRAPQHVRLLEGSGPSCTHQHPHYDTQPNTRCEAGDRLRGRAGGHSGIGEAGWPWQRHSMHAVLPDVCRIHSTVNGARCVRRHRRDKIVRKSRRWSSRSHHRSTRHHRLPRWVGLAE